MSGFLRYFPGKRAIRGVALAWVMTWTLWATAAHGQSNAETYDLRPHFVQGRTARYEVWTRREQTISMTAGPRTQSSNSTFELWGEVTWTVESVRGDGSATCVMTMDWLAADTVLPDGQVQRNDSRRSSGDNEPVHRLFRALAGAPVRVEVDASGAPTTVRDTRAIRHALGEYEAMTPDDRDFLESATDLATLAAVPPQLRPGADWRTRFAWSHPTGTLHQDMRYRLNVVEEIAGIPVAMVDGQASVRLEPQLPDQPPGGPSVSVRLTDGQVATQVMFDLLRHEAVGRNTVETRTIESRVSLSGQTFTRTLTEYIHSQVLRIAEQ